MRLSNLHRLLQLKNQIVSCVIRHKILIIVSLILSILLITLGMLSMKLRNHLLSQLEADQKAPTSDIYYATTSGSPDSNLESLLSSSDSALSISDNSGASDIGDDEILPTSAPYTPPIITPEPTAAPVYVYSPPSCAGTPTVDNSQVYVSPGTTQVNSASTITVDLADCNNTIAPVSDTLTIALVSGDPGTKINGSSAPVTIETKDGKLSFSVNSSNATTATFLITDITRSFSVTTPGYHNPSVTFSNNSSGSAHCTTAAGVPNLWYSDVYPNPPISTDNGSITIIVDIRDCNQSLAPVTDILNISVSSGDPSTQVNGGSLPQNVTTQNGEARFNVTSQTTGTVTLTIQDTTSSFTVTDKYSNNPSVTFNGSSTPTTTDTPTPIPMSTDTPTPTPATVNPTDTPTPGPSGATGST